MHIEKCYRINLWSEWDDEVGNAVFDFFEEYGMMPNSLVANPWTISQFEFITGISDLRKNTFMYDPKTKEYAIPLGKDEPVEISRFSAHDDSFDLEFYFNESFTDKEFALFFTDEDGDEEILSPVDEPVLIQIN